MKHTRFFFGALAVLAAVLSPLCLLHAQDALIISEFMADNEETLQDEDGDNSDWIEIYNSGTNTVDLAGWYLTDAAGNRTKWRFPSTNLPPNSFIVVFASNKDRRTPGRPLHSNFALNNSGEYLALVKPDGVTVQSVYAPAYPIQVPGVSYGSPVTISTAVLVSNGAPAKMTVPLNPNLGLDWTLPEFDDAAWASVNNGIGFESGGPPAALASTAIADSVADFSANQGANGWSYGYWAKKTDINATYEPTDFTPFPRGTGNAVSSTNYWNGAKWDWPQPNPPPTELSSTGGVPAGDNGTPANPVHWVVRRYVSETNGPLRISGTLACSATNASTGNIPGSCGDGVIGRIFVDGAEVFSRSSFGTSLGYSLLVNASLGSTIDFVIDPGAADNDQCDSNTVFTAVIRTAGDAAILADTSADWSETGAQGYRGWTYGFFVKTNASLAYASNRFSAFPSGTGPHSVANFWNGESWEWFDGDPPFDMIGRTISRPSIFASSSSTNNLEHWVIRRWVSEITGAVSIDWHFAKQDLSGLTAGSSATAKIFHNGTQRDSSTVTFGNFIGTNKTTASFNVSVGDVIDFTVEPGSDIVGDICFFNATIYGVTTLSNQFNSDVGTLMTNINATSYLRIPFTITDPAVLNTLTLRIKYDDGVAAYLNGSPVAGFNTPATLEWNSTAISPRTDAEASQWEEINLTLARTLLRQGDNVLAIQGLNSSATDPDFLIAAELQAMIATVNPALRNYFALPTPGSVNGAGSTNIGPLITDVVHTPHEPEDTEDLYVTARISPTLRPVGAVRLYYRVQFGSEIPITMLDDGLNADGPAGDGVYGGVIPHSASGIGQMVRYYITAADANNSLTRVPPFPNPTFSSQYLGAVVQNPSLTNPLPVLHLFITEANLNSANNSQLSRFPCSLYWAGEFYDNVGINRHGQSSQGFPKKSYDVDFNPDHHFKWDPDEERVDDVNLLTTYPDKSHMRNILSYDTYRDAGLNSPYHFTVPIRMQTNGGFFGTWHIVENGDADFLKRTGRDPNGALYKMYNTFTSIGNTTIGTDPNAEKKTRRYEGNADLVALFNGVASGTTAARVSYMYDNINVSEVANTMAARIVTSDVDCCHKNYYFYRDSEGTGEWEALPWDVDLAFGRNWQSGETYYDDRVYPMNGLFVGNNNSFFQLVFSTATTRQMYLRRLRTLMDELQQTNGTPASQLYYETKIDELAARLTPDAAIDLEKWGTWGGGATGIRATNSPFWRTLPQSVAELKTNYMPRRRTFVFDQKFNSAEFPNAQPTNVTILIGSIESNPSSGNQDEEYIQLINTNNIAVDISGWKLSGAVQHTFQAGVVIPSLVPSNRVYVVSNKKAFRARATAPRGGMGLFVEGPYQGQLSARGETIILSDKNGRVVATNVYPGNPSLPQQYLRVTEIMYHPAPAPNGPYLAEEFEYIELKNIGPEEISLLGVRFANGIDFAFTDASTVTSLAAGQRLLLVKNTAAFTARYGSSHPVGGQFGGQLGNEGERIQLLDGSNEEILDFEYENDWYPITDGAGFSLVIADENGDPDLWDQKEGWRPSGFDDGSPGQGDTPPATVGPVLVNEVLTHTDLPAVDYIELYNPGATDVNIGGWFLSDDFATGRKYRIPDNTIVPAGGYRVFEETSFNEGSNAFSLSSNGDEAYLFSGDGTRLTGFYHGYAFGAAENGVSFGRYHTSTGGVHFVAQSANTPGATNATPKVGPVIVSEIMYHPVDLAGGVDNLVEEFIELRNITGQAVPLFDAGNTWRVRGGVDFDFPPNVTLGPNAFALVVSFHPDDVARATLFRTKYGLAADVPLYGPYAGDLSNDEAAVRVDRPGEPGEEEVPYIVVDEVGYGDDTPWPFIADGVGLSLQRLRIDEYGNDVINWTAVAPTPNAPYPGGTLPTITVHPMNGTVVATHTATFMVEATGSPPLSYQWRLNGTLLPGATGSMLVVNDVSPDQGGNYSVIVYNGAGFVESSNAFLTVLIPASILQHPQSDAVRPGESATFTVAATSSTPITYQWQKDGVNIPGATSNVFTLSNAQLSDGALYRVVVTDTVGSIFSAEAKLTIWINPLIVQQPVGASVPVGGTVTLSVAVTNTATLPLGYRWRRSGATIAFREAHSYQEFFTVTNVTNLVAQSYTVVITNDASRTGILSAGAPVRALADTDQDGIPDEVEAVLGLDADNAADAGLDADNDTMSNWEEYIAGTIHTNAQSYLKVDKVSAAGSATIEFLAVSNRTYTVLYTDDLGSNLWSNLTHVVARTNNQVTTVLDPTPTKARIYRLATPHRP